MVGRSLVHVSAVASGAALVARGAIALPRLTAQPGGTVRSGALRRAQVAHGRAVPRRARERGLRRPRAAQHLLLRLGRRRRVEVDQQRPHLDADLRRHQRRVDRRDRRRAVEPRRRSTSAPARPTCATRSRSATACTSPPTPARRWKHIGLESTRQIGRVIVHPRDPNIVFVAALGHVYGPHPDRGVYRSRDGGTTWQKVLFKGDGIGAIDLAFDPSNPQTVYAALWAVRRPPWFIYAPANGPGSGLYKSTDGGTTWTPADERPAGRRSRPHGDRDRADQSATRST